MVKQTFLNLAEEKRQRILEVAMEEFATHKYSKASLTSIVSRAGISKGSIYQYFEDKKDLFVHLLEIAAQEKIAYISQALNPQADFFTAMEQSIIASVKFMRDHPKMSRVIANAMEPSGDEVLEELNNKGRQMSLEFFEKLLSQGEQEGIIRADVDIRFAAYMTSAIMGSGLADYLLDHLGISVKDYLSDPEPANKITQEMLDYVTSEIGKFLRSGLGKKGS